MKLALFACVAAMSCFATASASNAAESVPAVDASVIQTPLMGEARTYYREHRLRAYEKTRASMSQGATCVTPQLVCWLDETATGGDTCSCETPHHGVVGGVVGG